MSMNAHMQKTSGWPAHALIDHNEQLYKFWKELCKVIVERDNLHEQLMQLHGATNQAQVVIKSPLPETSKAVRSPLLRTAAVSDDEHQSESSDEDKESQEGEPVDTSWLHPSEFKQLATSVCNRVPKFSSEGDDSEFVLWVSVTRETY